MSKSTKKVETEIEFDSAELVRRVTGFAADAEKSRTGKIRIPDRIESIAPGTIKTTRGKLKMTQTEFARLMNVPTTTIVSWENGVRKPSGAALRLLDIARRKPEVVAA